MSMKFLQHLRELILQGYVTGLIPRDLARRKCSMITREIEHEHTDSKKIQGVGIEAHSR
jgi:hypothetical protein